MADFEATVILDIKISAPNEAAARAIIKEALTKALKLAGEPDTRLRLVRPQDGRLIAQLPNLPKNQVLAAMMEWPDAKTILYASCAKPRTRHQLFQAVHERLPLVVEHDIAVLLRELTVDGWLKPYVHNRDIDQFPADSTRQQILALAGS